MNLARRVATLVFGSAVAGSALLVGAGPAAADPAKPTDYRSRIDSVTPAVDGVAVDILGGDSFLRVRVEPGHTVVVEGYGGEPYVQILDDGTVQENLRSEATYLNVDRYADVEVPAGLEPDDEPEWQTVDDDGEYAWHDHRIHWMSPTPPADVARGDAIPGDFVVPLQVDGTPVAVNISIVFEKPVGAPASAGLAAAGAGLLAVLGALGWRRRSLPVAAAGALGASVLATVTGRAESVAVPPDIGGSPLVFIVPLIGLVASVVAVVLLLRRRPPLAGIALLAAAAALAGWALLRVTVLWKPVLPTDLPFAFDRLATVAAIAAAVGVAALTLHSGAVTPAPITDDE